MSFYAIKHTLFDCMQSKNNYIVIKNKRLQIKCQMAATILLSESDSRDWVVGVAELLRQARVTNNRNGSFILVLRYCLLECSFT